MALTCEDVKARLVDLVYGEATGDERRALEAHVNGCAQCRAELEALGRARAAVRARLDEAPPRAAHARILQAAAEAVAAAPARVASGAPVSFWTRLRGRWTFPTLATAGAVALMLLASRLFLNPQRTYERGRQGLSPVAAEPAAAPSAVAEPERPPTPDEMEGTPARSAPAAAAQPQHVLKADRLHELAAPKAVPRSMRSLVNPERPMAPSLPPPVTDDVRSAAASARHASASSGGGARSTSGGRVAASGSAAAPAPAPPRRVAKKEISDSPLDMDDSLSGLVRERAAPAEGAAPAPASAPALEKKAAKPNKREEADGASPSLEVLARRADRLFAEQRWPEAAQAYQQLLRQFPGADAAPRWRTRLAEARRAQGAP